MKNTEQIDTGISWAADYVIQRADRKPIEVEQKVEVMDKAGRLLTFGYLDAAWRDPDGVLNLADLKTGSVREYRPQLTVYALALMQREGVEEVLCHELYSELTWANVYTVTKDEAERLINKIVSMKKNPTKSPACCEYCNWCKHQLHCTALNSTAMTVAERCEEVVVKYHPSDVTSPLLLSRMLTVANALDSWIKAVKERSKSFDELPGFKQVNSRGRPTVKDLSSAFLKSGLSADEFLSACSLNLNGLAKVLAEKNGVDVKSARNEIENILGDLVKTGPPIQYWRK